VLAAVVTVAAALAEHYQQTVRQAQQIEAVVAAVAEQVRQMVATVVAEL
jgi:hypothetical protein